VPQVVQPIREREMGIGLKIQNEEIFKTGIALKAMPLIELEALE